MLFSSLLALFQVGLALSIPFKNFQEDDALDQDYDDNLLDAYENAAYGEEEYSNESENYYDNQEDKARLSSFQASHGMVISGMGSSDSTAPHPLTHSSGSPPSSSLRKFLPRTERPEGDHAPKGMDSVKEHLEKTKPAWDALNIIKAKKDAEWVAEQREKNFAHINSYMKEEGRPDMMPDNAASKGATFKGSVLRHGLGGLVIGGYEGEIDRREEANKQKLKEEYEEAKKDGKLTDKGLCDPLLEMCSSAYQSVKTFLTPSPRSRSDSVESNTSRRSSRSSITKPYVATSTPSTISSVFEGTPVVQAVVQDHVGRGTFLVEFQEGENDEGYDDAYGEEYSDESETYYGENEDDESSYVAP